MASALFEFWILWSAACFGSLGLEVKSSVFFATSYPSSHQIDPNCQKNDWALLWHRPSDPKPPSFASTYFPTPLFFLWAPWNEPPDLWAGLNVRHSVLRGQRYQCWGVPPLQFVRWGGVWYFFPPISIRRTWVADWLHSFELVILGLFLGKFLLCLYFLSDCGGENLSQFFFDLFRQTPLVYFIQFLEL